MDLLSIIFIGIGLAMDCFAVSIAQGVDIKRWSNAAVLMALLFGVFQGGMPLIGFYAGTLFASFISRCAPWVALALLGGIGGKMIRDSLQSDRPADYTAYPWRFTHLLVLAVATSIDALATGVIFIPYSSLLWLGIAIIAFTSFLFSLLGYWIGVQIGKLRINVELCGGIILIIIGLKIWFEGCFL